MSEGGSPARAYTLAAGFSGDAELRSAHALAARWGASHTVVRVEEESLPDYVVETVLACETPIWNGLAAARHLFFRGVRKQGETALLSGVGADELLCGNPAAMQAWPEGRRAERELAESLLTEGARRTLTCPAGEATDLERLRRCFIEIVLPDSTLPPECRNSVAAGVDVRLPYLDPAFAVVALRLPASACTRDGVGKWPLREAARGLVTEDVRSAPKTARLAPGGGGGERARRRWLDLYTAWLRPDRLAPLECVDAVRAAALLERFASSSATDSKRAILDAVLLRLASLAILAETA
jgi:asparagine synthase (glutamine-hydrolysing)